LESDRSFFQISSTPSLRTRRRTAPVWYDADRNSRSPTTSGVAALTDACMRERQRFVKRTVPSFGSSPTSPVRVRKKACRTPSMVAATGDE
jgi:hypothetical protein